MHWSDHLFTRLQQELARRIEDADPLTFNFTLPVEQADLDGELELGTVVGKPDLRFCLPIDRIPLNILATGTVGTGKTNFSLVLAEEAIHKGIKSVSIIDPKADEYEALARKHADIPLLRWSDLRFNMFTPPPNVPWIEFIQLVVGHLSSCYNFWEGGIGKLLKILERDRAKQLHPTLKSVLSELEEKSRGSGQKDAMIRSTLISRIEMMLQLFGERITTESNMLDVLFNSHFILSTSGLMDQSDSWLTEYLLLWEFMYRTYNPDKRSLALRTFDECQHRLFSSHKERSMHQTGAPLISRLVDESRVLSLGICALSQEPSTLIRAMLNNSGLKICFHQGSGTEIRIMREAMGLSSKPDLEQAQMLHYLEPGQAIVRMTSGYKDAYPVQIDRFNPEPCMNDDEFRSHQAHLKKQLYAETIYSGATKVIVSDLNFANSNHFPEAEVLQSKVAAHEINRFDEVKRFLQVWLNLENIFLTQGELFKLVGIKSGSRQFKFKCDLIRLGMIIDHKLQIRKTFSSIFEPTDKAYKVSSVVRRQTRSKGGYVHSFIASRVSIWGKASGYKPTIEFFLSNSKAIDVVLRKPEETIFIEIAISEPLSKEVINVVKDFGTEFTPTEFWILVVNGKMKKKMEQLIAVDSQIAKFRNLIEVKLAGDYI